MYIHMILIYLKLLSLYGAGRETSPVSASTQSLEYSSQIKDSHSRQISSRRQWLFMGEERGVRDATRSHEDLTGGASDRTFLGPARRAGKRRTEGWWGVGA